MCRLFAGSRYLGDPLHRQESPLLVVEGERAMRNLVRGVLESRGYTVLRASNGQEGKCVAREHGGQPLGLLITDVGTSEMRSDQLAEWRKTAGCPQSDHATFLSLAALS